MTKNKSKQNENIVSKDSLIGEVYFSLKSLSEKYGYAKDYLGQLSRSGRIEAIRYGKYGQWYASEDSLKRYRLFLSEPVSNITSEVESKLVISGSKPDILPKVSPFPAEITPVSIGHESETANVPPVLSTVLFKNDGSYSADSGLVSQKNNLELAVVPERINAILTLTIVLGGILFFTNIHPLTNLDIIKTPLVSKFSENFKKNIQSAWNEDIQLAKETLTTVGNLIPIGAKNTTASIWTNFLTWLFPNTPTPTYITTDQYNQIIKDWSYDHCSASRGCYESRITNLENQSSSLTGPTGATGPSGQTIIRETIIQSGSAFNLNTILTDLASLNQEVDSINSNFNLQFATLNSRINNLSLPSFNLPSTNTGGIGPITLNPQNLVSETLTISGASNLYSLALTNDLTIDTDVLRVNTTTNRVGINTSTPEVAFEVVGAASVSGAFTVGSALTVAGNIGIGTTSVPNQLTVIGSGSFTGQLKATRAPVLAHTDT